jgi:serine/threonine-protein kinase HipA
MHLKNFSIYEPAEGVFRLSPAYDLLNAAIVNPKDDEELALTLNGRKKNINMADFLKLAETLGIEAVTIRRLAEKFIRLLPKSEEIIDSSFVPEKLKTRYKELLRERLARLR